MKVILDYSTTTGHIFRTTLGFKKYDIILNKEKSVLTKIKSSSEREKILTKYSVLSRTINLYFNDYKLAI